MNNRFTEEQSGIKDKKMNDRKVDGTALRKDTRQILLNDFKLGTFLTLCREAVFFPFHYPSIHPNTPFREAVLLICLPLLFSVKRLSYYRFNYQEPPYTIMAYIYANEAFLAKAKLGRLAKCGLLANAKLGRFAKANFGRFAKAKLGRFANAKLGRLANDDIARFSSSSSSATSFSSSNSKHPYQQITTPNTFLMISQHRFVLRPVLTLVRAKSYRLPVYIIKFLLPTIIRDMQI